MGRPFSSGRLGGPKVKKYGTVLTDYDKAREPLRESNLRAEQREKERKAKGGGFRRYDEEDLDKIKTQNEAALKANLIIPTTTPTLLADETAITKKKRKKISSDRLTSGRMSTILGDTLG